jgi:glutaredoxin-related protein
MEADLEYVFVNCDFSKKFRSLIRDELSWPTFPIIIVTDGDETKIIGGSEQLKGHLKEI